MDLSLMNTRHRLAASAALLAAALPARADQILGPVRVVSGTNAAVLPDGPTLGSWERGKFTSQTDAIHIEGAGSTGDVSGMSVTAGGTTSTLAARHPSLAPPASPQFMGTVMSLSLNLTESGLTGDVSGASVTIPGAPISSEISDIAVQPGISVLGYVSASAVAAGSDVSAGFTQAITAARQAARPLLVPGAPGGVCYVINKSVEISQVEIAGTGGCISTTAAIDTFYGTSYNGKIHGLTITHTGTSGSIFKLDSEANEIFENRITAQNAFNSSPIIFFSQSNNHIFRNFFTNLRPHALTWKQQRTNPKSISINNQIIQNYMGGTGQGGWIGDNGSGGRPEGTLVALNESVLTGGPFLTLSSVLSARIIGNMADQGSTKGSIRFEPSGYNAAGVEGVLIQGNYISAANGNAAALQNEAGVGGAQARGIQIVGNEIAFGSLAASFVPGISATFSSNTMHGFASDHAIKFSDPTLITSVEVGAASQAAGVGLLSVSGGAQAGSVRSIKVGTYPTATGGGYMLIPHGLALPPTKFRIGISLVGPGAAHVKSANAMVVAVDGTNVTLAVTASDVAANGNVFVTLDSEI
jgi:hypothetical protein